MSSPICAIIPNGRAYDNHDWMAVKAFGVRVERVTPQMRHAVFRAGVMQKYGLRDKTLEELARALHG